MSYSIYIGEAKLREEDPDDRDGELVAQYHVDGAASPDAPTFENDEMTGNGNARHPGYGAWSDFAKSVGLYDFFFDKGGLKADLHGIRSVIEAYSRSGKISGAADGDANGIAFQKGPQSELTVRADGTATYVLDRWD